MLRLISRLRGQRGFTLIELLVGTTLGLIVLTASLSLLVRGLHESRSSQNRIDQVATARTSVDKVVRLLRDATGVTITNAQNITFTPAGKAQMTIACSTSTKKCTSTQSGVTKTMFTNIVNSDIFSYSGTSTVPTYVGVKLQVSATGHTNYTLADGANVRNNTLGL